MNETLVNVNMPILILSCSTLLLLGVCCFLIGYMYGKSRCSGVYNVVNNRPKNFFDTSEDNAKINKIAIDNSKFVSDIKTDNLEKKYDTLGDTKQTTETINESVNKLKNLKR